MVAIHLMFLCALRDLVRRVHCGGPGQFPKGAWFHQGCQLKTQRSSYTAVFHMKSCGEVGSQRVRENELPVAHASAGVQAAWLTGAFPHLLDKSGTRNTPRGVIPPSPPGLCLGERMRAACRAQNALCSSVRTHTSPVRVPHAQTRGTRWRAAIPSTWQETRSRVDSSRSLGLC